MLASTQHQYLLQTLQPQLNMLVLTPAQILKLNATQTQLTALVAKIDSLKKTYNNTKSKGLLIELNQYEKQAKTLNTTITNYKKNPTGPSKIKIAQFQLKTKQLQYKVLVKAAILKKINTPKPIHPITPVHPVTNHTTNCTA